MHAHDDTIQMLLKKPENRLSAILMAEHTLRVCDHSLFTANEQVLIVNIASIEPL
jgi:hypothetical protein